MVRSVHTEDDSAVELVQYILYRTGNLSLNASKLFFFFFSIFIIFSILIWRRLNNHGISHYLGPRSPSFFWKPNKWNRKKSSRSLPRRPEGILWHGECVSRKVRGLEIIFDELFFSELYWIFLFLYRIFLLFLCDFFDCYSCPLCPVHLV